MPELVAIDPRAALAIHIMVAAAILAAALGLAALLREPSRVRMGVYESGAPPGPARLAPVTASYVFIAIAFMIFDVEAALLFAWAGAAREVGQQGLIAATRLHRCCCSRRSPISGPMARSTPGRSGANDADAHPARRQPARRRGHGAKRAVHAARRPRRLVAQEQPVAVQLRAVVLLCRNGDGADPGVRPGAVRRRGHPRHPAPGRSADRLGHRVHARWRCR